MGPEKSPAGEITKHIVIMFVESQSSSHRNDHGASAAQYSVGFAFENRAYAPEGHGGLTSNENHPSQKMTIDWPRYDSNLTIPKPVHGDPSGTVRVKGII